MTSEIIKDILNNAIMFGLSALAIIKSVQSFVEGQTKKQELISKEKIDLADAEVELAKNNVLAASQVLVISEKYHEVLKELETIKTNLCNIKTDSEEKTQEILKMIDKIEDMIKQNNQNFTSFIISKRA